MSAAFAAADTKTPAPAPAQAAASHNGSGGVCDAATAPAPGAAVALIRCRLCVECPGFTANPFRKARCRECSHDAATHEGLTDEQQAAAQLSRDDTKPSEIIPGVLYLGGLQAALNDTALHAAGVTHVVCCAKDLHTFLPNFKPNTRDFTRLTVPWTDTSACCLDAPPTHHLQHALAFIHSAVAGGGACFVHCAQGVSRSGALAVAYVMRSQRLPYAQALAFVRARRVCVQPNSGFEQQLIAFGQTLATSDAVTPTAPDTAPAASAAAAAPAPSPASMPAAPAVASAGAAAPSSS